MSNYIFCVKGVSGSGKSSRVLQLLKFFENEKLTLSDFKFTNFEGKEKTIGVLVEEISLVFIGKIYKSGEIERWQGYDVVTGSFGKSEHLSSFLKENSKKYSFIIEGAGVTRTNRLRPLYLHDECGFDNIFMQYYNYSQDQKPEYLNRIVGRSGKEPGKGTMWDKCIDFEREGEVSKQECLEVKCRTFHSYDLFDVPINDFGIKFLNFLGLPDFIDEFKKFTDKFDYISINKFENFQEELKPVKIEKTKSSTPKEIKKETKVVTNFGSIFTIYSMNREEICWEDYLYELTPVQKVGELNFKRDDMFAPLGYGGINGSKLRQAIWLANDYKNSGGKGGLISGASVKSPQLPMGSAVALHFGMPSEHVVGATRPETSINKDMVKMATWFKAKFNYLKVGYNPVLQNKVKSLLDSKNKGDFYLNYGITVPSDSPIEKIVEFHQLGANQVQNIPDDIETIIIPAGSGNSAISILLGLSIFKPTALKKVYMFGIGPNKTNFIFNRLKIIKEKTGINTLDYVKGFNLDIEFVPTKHAYKIEYLDIHSIPKYDYQNEVKCSYEGITFHPTYEGKMFDYLKENLPELINDKTLFWIVGSKPSMDNMSFLKEELGEYPTEVNVSSNAWED